MKALIVDDERLARNELRRLLRAHPDIEVVGEAASSAEAVERIESLAPDLMFLDIEMPGGNGFQLLERLERAPVVIFTTAFDAHALRAFEVNALDYLLKPIEPNRLAVALDKARLQQVSRSTPRGEYLERVFIRDGERCWFVRLAEVPLLESEGNYTRVFLESAQPLLPRSLNVLEQRLDPGVFFRANRKHLINLNCITRIDPGWDKRLVAQLQGGHTIELSRRQSQLFAARMSL